MSRFSGLPDPRDTTRIAAIRAVTVDSGVGARRFDELLSKGSSSRLAAHQQAKGSPIGSASARRLAGSSEKPPAAAVTAPPPKAKVTEAPKPPPPKVPAHVEAKGPIYASAYREGFSRFGKQVERLKGRPEAQGRIGSLMMLATEDIADGEILSKLGTALTDQQRAADAVWDRAYAMIAKDRGVNTTAAKLLVAQRGISPPTAKAQQILANQRAFGGGKRSSADERADSVWDRAWASVSQRK